MPRVGRGGFQAVLVQRVVDRDPSVVEDEDESDGDQVTAVQSSHARALVLAPHQAERRLRARPDDGGRRVDLVPRVLFHIPDAHTESSRRPIRERNRSACVSLIVPTRKAAEGDGR